VEPIIPLLHGFRSDPIGFASGEYLPLPRSKGGVFPFLLTSIRLRRTALSQSSPCLPQAGQPAAGRSGTTGSTQIGESPRIDIDRGMGYPEAKSGQKA